jgi:hypothetical protein
VVLVMICAVGTESDLHAHILTAQPSKTLPAFGGFHPRAHARGPQPKI